jgi:hypothetical protein
LNDTQQRSIIKDNPSAVAIGITPNSASVMWRD